MANDMALSPDGSLLAFRWANEIGRFQRQEVMPSVSPITRLVMEIQNFRLTVNELLLSATEQAPIKSLSCLRREDSQFREDVSQRGLFPGRLVP